MKDKLIREVPKDIHKVHPDRLKQRKAKGFFWDSRVCERCGKTHEGKCQEKITGLRIWG